MGDVGSALGSLHLTMREHLQLFLTSITLSNLLLMKSEKGRTTFLEHEIATSLLNNWKNNKKTAEDVQSIVSKTENRKGDLTIYHNAHLQAQETYAAQLEKAKTLEPSTS